MTLQVLEEGGCFLNLKSDGVSIKIVNLKYFLTYYIFFCIACISLGIFIGFALDVNMIVSNPPKTGHSFMSVVLTSNTKNFILYLFLPVLSPILQIFDLVSSSLQITLGIRLYGIQESFKYLFPHSFLEFPNFIFYQGLSQYMLFVLIKTRSITQLLTEQKKFIKLYFLSFLILIFSAIVEGFVG